MLLFSREKEDLFFFCNTIKVIPSGILVILRYFLMESMYIAALFFIGNFM